MAGNMSTVACRLGVLGPWGSTEAGQLTLDGDVLEFTADDGRNRWRVFSAPVSTVKVRYPWLYFGLGLRVTVAGKRHGFWFIRMRSASGEQTADGQTILVGNAFAASELSRARSITTQWRTVLSSTGT